MNMKSRMACMRVGDGHEYTFRCEIDIVKRSSGGFDRWVREYFLNLPVAQALSTSMMARPKV